jgi:hypothetical protein
VTVRWIAALAALVVVTMPCSASAAVFPFPSEHSSEISDGAAPPGEVGYFSEIDDGVAETFVATKNVNRAHLSLRLPYNSFSAVATWALEINGARVMTFDVDPALGVMSSLTALFAPITGPSYDVRLRLLSDDGTGGRQSLAFGSIELIDSLRPGARIDASSDVDGGPVEVRFSSPAADVVRFECSLDSAAFTPCASPVVYSSLSFGQHPFAVRAIDDAGNVGTPARRTLRPSSLASCPSGAATVQAGSVTTLKLGCVAYRGVLATSILKWPSLGMLGFIDQATQTVRYAAPRAAGMTSFSYRSPQTNLATFALTVRGPVGSGVRAGWHVADGYTKVRRLSVSSVPAWGAVSMRCLHKGCSYHRSWPAAASGHRALNLVGGLAHRRLKPGTVIQIRIAAPYATSAKVVRYTIRAHRQPLRTVTQPPRSKK